MRTRHADARAPDGRIADAARFCAPRRRIDACGGEGAREALLLLAALGSEMLVTGEGIRGDAAAVMPITR
jgi:hypothetical protein